MTHSLMEIKEQAGSKSQGLVQVEGKDIIRESLVHQLMGTIDALKTVTYRID